MPWEVVQVAVPACQQETNRNGIRFVCPFVALGAYTSGMNETRLFRSIGVRFDLEQIQIDIRHQPAFHAAKPPRKRPDRNPDLSLRRKGTDSLLSNERGHAQSIDLRTQNTSNRRQQASLLDRDALIDVPVVESHGDDG
jgi:hypothetical protein